MSEGWIKTCSWWTSMPAHCWGLAPARRRLRLRSAEQPSSTTTKKKRVERFREYATGEFTKRNLDGALTELIGGLTLDAALRDRSCTERELDEGAPWEALRWQRQWDPSADDGALRWKLSTALEVLGTLAHVADEGFESTHGRTHRK